MLLSYATTAASRYRRRHRIGGHALPPAEIPRPGSGSTARLSPPPASAAARHRISGAIAIAAFWRASHGRAGLSGHCRIGRSAIAMIRYHTMISGAGIRMAFYRYFAGINRKMRAARPVIRADYLSRLPFQAELLTRLFAAHAAARFARHGIARMMRADGFSGDSPTTGRPTRQLVCRARH